MVFNLTQRRYLMLWQLLFIILGTTWLWAPHLNPGLSYRTSLISQYETTFQPYSWLFRLGDLLSGLFLFLAASVFYKTPNRKIAAYFLMIISIGIFIDPLLTTTCHLQGSSCREYISVGFVAHAIETVITSATFFVIAVYDAWLRKKLVSITFVLFQMIYGILFVSQLASQENFNTFSQYVYQTALVVWLAWFCRDALIEGNFKVVKTENNIVKIIAAAWAFINGLLAIIISLAHIHLLGKIKGLYFAGDSAWLAQHGVIIGVVLLYISRHLARGEARARQIFLAIVGVETLKYSVISPNPGLMLLYLLTFTTLFIFRDDFDRGTVALTWRVRLKELYFMISALLLAVLISLLILDRDNRVTIIASRSFDNFFDYVARSDITAKSHLRSALLAHTVSAFLIVSVAIILWILFRPYKNRQGLGRDYGLVKSTLQKYSSSSEDYFKLWPADKDYFWSADGNGFVAYKLVGSVIFALADPVAKSKDKLLEEFMVWCKSRRLKLCLVPVYADSLKIYEKAGLQTLQIGSSALIDIDEFLDKTVKDKRWRWQKNRANKSGYVYDVSDPPHSEFLLRQLKPVSDAWLKIGGHVERGFALGYFDLDYLKQCRIHFLKEPSGTVIAFTNQLPNLSASKTVTVDMLRYLPYINNAMSYLLYKTIESLRAETNGYRYFDLGFAPFAKAKGPILAITKTLSSKHFSARGLEQFKNKFNPDWQPNYLAYDGDLADLALIALHLEKAMEQN